MLIIKVPLPHNNCWGYNNLEPVVLRVILYKGDSIRHQFRANENE